MLANARDLVDYCFGTKLHQLQFAASRQLLVARILDQARQPQGGEAGKEREQGWRIGRN